MDGCDIRMGRVFDASGKAVVVACDHGMFAGPHPGMEDIGSLLARLGDGPDGYLMSPGMLPRVRKFFARRGAPGAIVRLNFNTVFLPGLDSPAPVISRMFQPEEALAAGADMALVCLTLRSGSEVTDARNVEIVADLCGKSHRLGLPVVGEYFPAAYNSKQPKEFHEEVLVGCRMLVEIGVDCIKTFHTNDFKRITGTCQVPILGLGGEKTPTDLAALELAEREMRDGASGVVFGRNAAQASNPAAFVAALQDVVKRGKGAREAAKSHQLTA